jgi:endonuclease YncB( thermonuclease family)
MVALPWDSGSQGHKPHSGSASTTSSGTNDISRPYPLSEPLLVVAIFTCGATTVLSTRYLYTRFCKRLLTSDDITSKVISKNRWLKGVVTSVGDGDNFRLYHTPGPGWRWPLKFRTIPTGPKGLNIICNFRACINIIKALKDQTIHIRLAGVDAPEVNSLLVSTKLFKGFSVISSHGYYIKAAHFGRPAQPYSDAALAWLKSYIEGRTVYCLPAHRDQYNRIVTLGTPLVHEYNLNIKLGFLCFRPHIFGPWKRLEEPGRLFRSG